MKRSELKRKVALARGELRRKGSALKRGAPKSRPKQRSKVERDLIARWNRAAARARRCSECGAEGPMEGHHAIRRAWLERTARSAGLAVEVVAWDLDWQVIVCTACHVAHTNRSKRLPLSVVPGRAWVAAEALDMQLEQAGLPATARIELQREYA